MFANSVRLECLCVYVKLERGALLKRRCANAEETQVKQVAQKKFFRWAVVDWPQYWDVFWRHLLSGMADHVIAVQAKKSRLYRNFATDNT